MRRAVEKKVKVLSNPRRGLGVLETLLMQSSCKPRLDTRTWALDLHHSAHSPSHRTALASSSNVEFVPLQDLLVGGAQLTVSFIGCAFVNPTCRHCTLVSARCHVAPAISWLSTLGRARWREETPPSGSCSHVSAFLSLRFSTTEPSLFRVA